MPLDPAKIAELDAIYGGSPPSLTPEKIAQLDAIYGVQQQAPQSPGFFARVGEKVTNRANELGANVAAYNQGNKSLPELGMNFLGKAGAGTVNDVIGETISTVTPDIVKSGMSTAARVTGNAIDPLAPAIGDTLLAAKDRFNSFMQNNPRVASQLESVGNIAAVIPAGKGATAATSEVAPLVVKAANKFENLAAKAPGMLGNTKSGVSANAALGGIPQVVATAPQGVVNRYKGLKALKPDELDDMVNLSHDNTSALYKAVDATGATLKPSTSMKLNNDILASIQNLQINPAASPKTIGAIKELYGRITVGKTNPITGAVTQAPLTVSELDGFRKLLNGIGGEDGVVANAVRDTIDNSLKKMTSSDFIGGGADAPKLLFEARANAAKTFKMQEVAQLIKKSGGDTRTITAAFKKYTDKPGWEKGLKPNEIAAIKSAAKYGSGESIERALGTFGFDFGRNKNVAFPVLTGGSSLAIPGGLPLVAVGTLTRQTGKYAARGKAQNVLDEIGKRK